MSIPRGESILTGAAAGWQNAIKGTNLAVSGTLTVADLDGNGKSAVAGTPLAGASLTTGTYYYYIPVAGCQNLDVTLRLASGTVPTITLYPVLSDGVSIKGTATSVTALVAAAQATTSLTTLKGERGVILKIVAGGTCSLDQADYSAI